MRRLKHWLYGSAAVELQLDVIEDFEHVLTTLKKELQSPGDGILVVVIALDEPLLDLSIVRRRVGLEVVDCACFRIDPPIQAARHQGFFGDIDEDELVGDDAELHHCLSLIRGAGEIVKHPSALLHLRAVDLLAHDADGELVRHQPPLHHVLRDEVARLRLLPYLFAQHVSHRDVHHPVLVAQRLADCALATSRPPHDDHLRRLHPVLHHQRALKSGIRPVRHIAEGQASA